MKIIHGCFLTLGIITLTFNSCKKQAAGPFLEGSYQGTFQRQSITAGPVSNVVLIFSPGDFIGQSQYPKYPALCNGTYSMSTDKIIFQNGCAWTADFDGTLILNGEYGYQKNGDSLLIFRYGNGTVFSADIYKLKKQ